MIGLKTSYEIAYNGTENECRFELYADTTADLQGLTHIDGIKIQMGSECTDIATGDKYILNGSGAWILQPFANAWQNVYTKAEIDSMITEINGVIAYYHTTLVSDTGEITFYALAGYIGTWKIYGNGQQTGTPTPDNPVMPTFCGVRTGNLHNPETDVFGYIDPNGVILSSSATKAADFIPCESESRYVLRVYKTGTLQSTNPRTVDFYAPDKSYIKDGRVSYALNGGEKYRDIPFVVPTGAKFLRFSYDIGYSKSMLNSGSTALQYEPYGYKIPITCAGQTTPVYLGQTQTVRRIKKLVLDGTEEWALVGVDYIHGLYIDDAPIENYEAQMCSHFIHASSWSELQNTNNSFAISSLNRIVIHDESIRTVEDFKSYLASQYASGHPVTIWYALATEQTGIFNEPLCKIGDYADELSSTDAAVTIPTIKGANTLTVETDLIPGKIVISGGE